MTIKLIQTRALKDILTASMRSASTIHPYALLAFNFYNEDFLRAAAQASQETKTPILVQAAPYVFEAYGDYAQGIQHYVDFLKSAAGYDQAQIALGLDHFNMFDKLDQLESALQIPEVSFLMVDASGRSPEENIKLTTKIVEMAHKHDLFVEGHYGSGIDGEEALPRTRQYENFAQAVEEFALRTTVDGINYHIGTKHGGAESKFRGSLLAFVQRYLSVQGINTPFGMHGGSSVSEGDLVKYRGHFSKLN